MRIGVDVMGGDNAPDAILDGSLASLPKLASDDELVLFGDEKIIAAALKSAPAHQAKVTVVATTEVVGMDESPVDAVRSKVDSSIVVCCKHASRKHDNPLDAVISAGSTGAGRSGADVHAAITERASAWDRGGGSDVCRADRAGGCRREH